MALTAVLSKFEFPPSVPYPIPYHHRYSVRFLKILVFIMEFSTQVERLRLRNMDLLSSKIVPNFFWRCLACLLSSSLFAMSAPLPSSSNGDFWVNPCKLEPLSEEDNVVTSTTIDDLFDEVINNSNVCYLQSRDVKQYVLELLDGVEEESLQGHKYDWLEPPKVDLEQFAELKKEDALKDLYYFLQKIAVVLEQILTDQSERDEQYSTHLTRAKANLIQVLCSLQLSMISLNIKSNPDATSDILSEELQTLSDSGKLLRDFIVFRELHLTAEYTRELVKFFKSQ